MSTTGSQKKECESHGLGTQVPFDGINDPGCYVCNSSGHILRVPKGAIEPGQSPVLPLSGTESSFATKISDDPFIPVTRARMLAANSDLDVNF